MPKISNLTIQTKNDQELEFIKNILSNYIVSKPVLKNPKPVKKIDLKAMITRIKSRNRGVNSKVKFSQEEIDQQSIM